MATLSSRVLIKHALIERISCLAQEEQKDSRTVTSAKYFITRFKLM